VDEVIVKFKGRLIFIQYIPRIINNLGSKFTNLVTGHTYDMRFYLGKDAHSAAIEMTAAHGTVRNLTRRVEGIGHKLWTISSLLLMIWLLEKLPIVELYDQTVKTYHLTLDIKH
jgi:hypothetical protein